MTWARIDDQSAFNMKVLFVGNAAWGALCRMVAHSCAELTDGFVAFETAQLIATKEELARLLLAPPAGKSPMLEPTEGGYQIHDFHDWNPYAADEIARRKADAERKAAARAKQGRGANGRMTSSRPPGRPDGQAPGHVADGAQTAAGVPPVPSPSPSPDLPSGDPPQPPGGEPGDETETTSGVHAKATDTRPRRRLDPGTVNFAWPDLQLAYGRGIERGKGGVWTNGYPPHDQKAIVRVIEAHCPDLSRMTEWLEADAERYARAIRLRPAFYGSFAGVGYEKWWGDECPTENASRGAKAVIQPYSPPPASAIRPPPPLSGDDDDDDEDTGFTQEFKAWTVPPLAGGAQ